VLASVVTLLHVAGASECMGRPRRHRYGHGGVFANRARSTGERT
jgi:hypothetical protein